MHKLMIVDDERPNLRLLERLFGLDYTCLTATSGAEAIQLLQRHDVAVLLTDQRMPEMTGLELLKQTAQLRPHMVRILLTGYTDVDALVEAINTGLVYMYITKPWNNSDLKITIARAVAHYENNKRLHSLTLTNERMKKEVNEMKSNFISAFSEALRMRDEDAYARSVRVSENSRVISETLRLRDLEQEELTSAALMYGLGHLGTPDHLFANSKNLTVPEQEAFDGYVDRGARLLEIAGLPHLGDVVRCHRENFDGTGCPGRLSGDQIPLLSRIIRVADEYDSLLHPRDSSAPLPPEQALSSLQTRAGKDFDPLIVEALEKSSEKISPAGRVEAELNWV